MKVNLIQVPSPMFTSFTMFADPNFDLLKETKIVKVSFRNHTKTRMSTSLQFGDYCVRINFSSPNFKTHQEIQNNYFSGGNTTSNYFLKSKKQDFEAYKEYVKEVVSEVITKIYKIDLDEVTIELIGGGF